MQPRINDLNNTNVVYPCISCYSISSSFYLTLNESSSQILLHDVHDSMKYKYLLRIPTCPRHMYINIEDIHSSGKEMSGKFCCLLVVVRCVSYCTLLKMQN